MAGDDTPTGEGHRLAAKKRNACWRWAASAGLATPDDVGALSPARRRNLKRLSTALLLLSVVLLVVSLLSGVYWTALAMVALGVGSGLNLWNLNKGA